MLISTRSYPSIKHIRAELDQHRWASSPDTANCTGNNAKTRLPDRTSTPTETAYSPSNPNS